MPKIAAFALVLALGLAVGCSRSDDAGSTDASTIQARELPEIWKDVLAERDRIQVATAKGHQMWHEDCEVVSKAAGRLDELVTEMSHRLEQMDSLADRRNGIASLMGNFQSLIGKIRSSAIQELVGEMPTLMISLDAFLRGVENHFKPEEIGTESVATRPGYNPVKPPPPPSPV